MSVQESLRPHALPTYPFSQGDGRGAPSPRQNRLLAELAPVQYDRLLAELQPLDLSEDLTLHGPGRPEEFLYFPTSGIVSRCYVTHDGASAQFAVTGNEGFIGVASLLGAGSTLTQAVVLSPGFAYRARSERLHDDLRSGGPLARLLLRYTQALIVQAGQAAVCNRHHSLEQRLCRWILSMVDRLPTNELAITQARIAGVLGVRRESITTAAGKLQEEGAIHCSRGIIAVLDRPRLVARACECYSVVKREFDRLLPPHIA
jgi:CRP-like cAMP-binding protein